MRHGNLFISRSVCKRRPRELPGGKRGKRVGKQGGQKHFITRLSPAMTIF